MMTKILVVDDEQDLCEILGFNLQSEGFEVVTANSAEEALLLLSNDADSPQFDLVLLDVMMDRMSGFDLARLLRSRGDQTPIIFLTAKEGHDDQLAGFAAGGDDYITKPFFFDTVLARVRAVLKRSAFSREPAPEPASSLSFGGLEIDRSRNVVAVAGKAVELTRREYEILCLLATHPGDFFTRESILDEVWPDDALVNCRGVDVHIARLRKKLGNEGRRILSRTGFGYYFSPAPVFSDSVQG